LEWSGVEWGKPFKHVFIFEKKSSSPEPAGQIQSNLMQIILA
jgi:hypothetical protein